MRSLLPAVVCVCALAACGSSGADDGGVAVGSVDAGGTDTAQADSGPASDGAADPDGSAAPDTAPDPLEGIAQCPVPEQEVTWPGTPPAPAPCTPLFDTFALPGIAQASGAIELRPSAVLQPLAHAEVIDITVRKTPGGATDAAAQGTLALEVPPGVEVMSVSELKAGRAVARVKVSKAGPHLISATLSGDPRQGSVGLYGYQTRLTVVEVEVAPADLAEQLAAPIMDIWKKVLLTVDGKPHSAKMRLHGGSSREHPKKSFRFNLDDMQGVDGRRRLVLRAEWSDRTLLRNYLGLELFRHGTWLPTSKARFVHLRINGAYYGVMLDVERIDQDFLAARGLRSDANLYEADPPSVKSVPGGNLTPLKDKAEYPLVYDKHTGAGGHEDIIALIEVVLQLAEAPLKAGLDRVVRVDEVLAYLAAMAVLQNQDHVRKNFYLYHDTEAKDCRWRLFPWDLDLSQGRLWTEENDILDDKLFTEGSIWAGTYVGHSFYNQLVDRLLTLEPWRSRYLKFIGQLLAQPFTETFFQQRVQAALCLMQPDLLADERKRSDNEDYPLRVGELKQFVAARRAYLMTALEAGP